MIKKEEKKESKKADQYWEGVGRRKTAVARVRLSRGSGGVSVNNREIENYFVLPRHRDIVMAPIRNLKIGDKLNVSARVIGGGISAQAEAVRHGLARALTLFDSELKKRLRNFGFLTRDPRMVERKKYGLKKARRAPQWSKR